MIYLRLLEIHTDSYLFVHTMGINLDFSASSMSTNSVLMHIRLTSPVQKRDGCEHEDYILDFLCTQGGQSEIHVCMI